MNHQVLSRVLNIEDVDQIWVFQVMANGTCENGDDWMEWGSIFSLMLNGTL